MYKKVTLWSWTCIARISPKAVFGCHKKRVSLGIACLYSIILIGHQWVPKKGSSVYVDFFSNIFGLRLCIIDWPSAPVFYLNERAGQALIRNVFTISSSVYFSRFRLFCITLCQTTLFWPVHPRLPDTLYFLWFKISMILHTKVCIKRQKL